MKIGDIVYLKYYRHMMGEILKLDEDKATLSLCGTGLEMVVDIADIGVTDSKQPHRADNTKVNVLGTEYTIRIVDKNDYRFNRSADGWCDMQTKEIFIFNYTQDKDSVKDLVAYQKKVLRHEIVHAFLYESGLTCNACDSKCWAKNEEMVDWIAIQEPKIHKAFKEARCDEMM